MNRPPIILTIAGGDASGAAGVQADLRTFQSLGVHGCSVISAITAQAINSTVHLSGSHHEFISQPVRLDVFRQQLLVLLRDFDIAAVKTGMLATPDQVECIANTLPKELPLIIDPVLQTSSGHTLIDADTLAAIRQWLLPRAWLITPNLPELPHLADSDKQRNLAPEDIVRALLDAGCKAVLVKGGHAESQQLSDVLYQYDKGDVLQQHRYSHPRQPGQYRGTGCVLSAAIATYIARIKNADSESLQATCKTAIDYLQTCIHHTPTPPGGEAAILRHPPSTTDY